MRIEFDQKDIAEFELMLNDFRLNGPKILARTLNKTASKALTLADRAIRSQVLLTSQYIKKSKNGIKIKKATWTRLSAKLTTPSRGLLMTRYDYRMLAKGGASVKIKKGGQRKQMSGAFLVNLKAGDRVVPALALPASGFYKTGNARFNVLYGPSISQVFNDVREDIDDEVAVYMVEVAEREIASFLRGF